MGHLGLSRDYLPYLKAMQNAVSKKHQPQGSEHWWQIGVDFLPVNGKIQEGMLPNMFMINFQTGMFQDSEYISWVILIKKWRAKTLIPQMKKWGRFKKFLF